MFRSAGGHFEALHERQHGGAVNPQRYIGEVPVWNVARHVIAQDFALIEV